MEHARFMKAILELDHLYPCRHLRGLLLVGGIARRCNRGERLLESASSLGYGGDLDWVS